MNPLLCSGDYLRFKDRGEGSLTKGREIEGLLVSAHVVPMSVGKPGRPIFRPGALVFIIQPWRIFHGFDEEWHIAPTIRYSLDDIEVLQHIPARKPAQEQPEEA